MTTESDTLPSLDIDILEKTVRRGLAAISESNWKRTARDIETYLDFLIKDRDKFQRLWHQAVDTVQKAHPEHRPIEQVLIKAAERDEAVSNFAEQCDLVNALHREVAELKADRDEKAARIDELMAGNCIRTGRAERAELRIKELEADREAHGREVWVKGVAEGWERASAHAAGVPRKERHYGEWPRRGPMEKDEATLKAKAIVKRYGYCVSGASTIKTERGLEVFNTDVVEMVAEAYRLGREESEKRKGEK